MEGQSQEDTPRKESYRRNWGSSRAAATINRRARQPQLGCVFILALSVFLFGHVCACLCLHMHEPGRASLMCISVWICIWGREYSCSYRGLRCECGFWFVFACIYFSAYISVGSYVVENNFFCFFAILPMKHGPPQRLFLLCPVHRWECYLWMPSKRWRKLRFKILKARARRRGSCL